MNSADIFNAFLKSKDNDFVTYGNYIKIKFHKVSNLFNLYVIPMESRKMILINLFAGRNRHREQTYECRERVGKGEMYGESHMETYITICKIDSQQDFAV